VCSYTHVKEGLRALGRHGNAILKASRGMATDSLAFDDVRPDSPTFDYLVGVQVERAAVVALEVHPAQTHEVERIVEKKRQTVAFLAGRRCACQVDRWRWAPTRGVHLRTATRARQLLVQNGIDWPVDQLDLRQIR
jgi:hypothetical protein